VLAEVRGQSWEDNIRPSVVTRLMQRSLWPYVVLTVLFLVVLGLVAASPWQSAAPFYSVISHTVMVMIFLPLFILPLIALWFGLRRYWQSVGGDRLSVADVISAFKSAATLRQLSGGQGQGCNYESGERYTSHRRWAHQAAMVGFLLCLASTSVATLYHYLFGYEAPYPFFSLPKQLGVIGGVLLSGGCLAITWLKWRAEKTLGSEQRLTGEYAFIGLLFLVSTTGLLLYWSSGTSMAGAWLVIHLAFVATFFVSLPYSKMSHGFFRLAALCREAQIKHQS
jgi:citrate/tricarballylate utilization protein